MEELWLIYMALYKNILADAESPPKGSDNAELKSFSDLLRRLNNQKLIKKEMLSQ